VALSLLFSFKENYSLKLRVPRHPRSRVYLVDRRGTKRRWLEKVRLLKTTGLLWMDPPGRP
jgi:hypothetical protein